MAIFNCFLYVYRRVLCFHVMLAAPVSTPCMIEIGSVVEMATFFGQAEKKVGGTEKGCNP